jgi:hypothetical protein
MYLQDHYAILELEPSATQPEIKQAYRRLAKQFHPDLHPGDPYAATRFEAVKDAYEVLTDPHRRDRYLQQRWYLQSLGRRKAQPLITPENLLREALELERHTARLDPFRLDQEGLQQYLLNLIPDPVIEKLRSFHQPETNDAICDALLRASRHLSAPFAKPVWERLLKLAEGLTATEHRIREREMRSTRRHSRERWMAVWILAVTGLLILLIWLAGR